MIWLARQGWQARGCDISATAVARARARASSLDLESHGEFERCDLSVALPEGAAGRFNAALTDYLRAP